jgi:hypothetical protein
MRCGEYVLMLRSTGRLYCVWGGMRLLQASAPGKDFEYCSCMAAALLAHCACVHVCMAACCCCWLLHYPAMQACMCRWIPFLRQVRTPLAAALPLASSCQPQGGRRRDSVGSHPKPPAG